MRHRFPPPFAQPVRGQHEGDRFPRGSLVQCVCRQRAFGCVSWHNLDRRFPATARPGAQRPDGKEVQFDTYGMIRWKQAVDRFADWGLTFGNPDFVKYAEWRASKGRGSASVVDLRDFCYDPF